MPSLAHSGSETGSCQEKFAGQRACGGFHIVNRFYILCVWAEAACTDDVTKDWYFFIPYLAFVCTEVESGLASTFYNCFQVGIVVSEVVSVNDDVIGDASYVR